MNEIIEKVKENILKAAQINYAYRPEEAKRFLCELDIILKELVEDAYKLGCSYGYGKTISPGEEVKKKESAWEMFGRLCHVRTRKKFYQKLCFAYGYNFDKDGIENAVARLQSLHESYACHIMRKIEKELEESHE